MFVSFNQIGTSYNSTYGSTGLRDRNKYTGSPEINGNKRSFRRNKSKSGIASALGTFGIIATTAFLTFTSKNAISKVGQSIGKAFKGLNLGGKFPNLAQAGKSLKEACKTPLKPFATAGKFVGNIFKKTK